MTRMAVDDIDDVPWHWERVGGEMQRGKKSRVDAKGLFL